MALLPGRVRPMLARISPAPFDSPRHLFEPKWDGYRCLLFLSAGVVRLQSRNLKDITAEFPALASLSGCWRVKEAVVDGEITAWEGGRPSFAALQARRGQLVFVAFDLLQKEGRELLDLPLEERKAHLADLVDPAPGLALSPGVLARGKDLFAAAVRLGWEGTVAKELGSPYLPGQRSRHWLKTKARRSADCVIVGYRLGPGGRLASLALALPQDEGWSIVGQVGSGWDEKTGREMLGKFRSAPPPGRAFQKLARGINWVKPELVCSVAYTELTPEGQLRHPVFLGLRPDLDPEEAGWEEKGDGE